MKLLSLLVTIFFNATWAGEGLVVVLEAHLLRHPQLKSNVVQSVRKGKKIYVHDKHFLDSPWENSYGVEEGFYLDQREEGFYETKDRNGNRAYIPKEYVKLIYKDEREMKQAVSPFSNDPTDYRLEEPLPKGYPIVPRENYRASIWMGMGPDHKYHYDYTDAVEHEYFSSRYHFSLNYLRKAGWDKYNRFYFGYRFNAWTAIHKFTLYSSISAIESKSNFGAGPVISYDYWRTQNFQLSLSGGVLVEYKRVFVKQFDQVGNAEERTFKGFAASPSINNNLQFRNVFSDIDMVLGVEYQFNLPHSLKISGETEFPYIWQKDRYTTSFSGTWTLFLGLQSNY